MSNWHICSDGVLRHHGIKGQKWGDRNGPPYPLDGSQASASEKKAGFSTKNEERKKEKKPLSNGTKTALIIGGTIAAGFLAQYANQKYSKMLIDKSNQVSALSSRYSSLMKDADYYKTKAYQARYNLPSVQEGYEKNAAKLRADALKVLDKKVNLERELNNQLRGRQAVANILNSIVGAKWL